MTASFKHYASAALLLFAGCSHDPVKTEHRWFGMDTDFSAVVYTGGTAGAAARPGKPLTDLDNAFARLERESQRLEQVFSDYLPGSSLRKLQGRTGDTLAAEPEITEVFHAAQEMAAASRGSFDITLHNLKIAWGLSSGQTGKVPSDSAIAMAMRGNPAFGAPLDSNPAGQPPFALLADGRLVLLRDSVVFDLGGIAKGYAVDRMHAVLDSLGYPDHIVKAGGDMRIGGSKGPEPWALGIRHPRNSEDVAGTLRLAQPLAVSTSGDYERFFIQDGVRYHHVFDPRTGRPARPYCSVTVLAGSSLLADRMTKPLFILGPAAGGELLKRFGARAVWMRETGEKQQGNFTVTQVSADTSGTVIAPTAADSSQAVLCYSASEGLEGVLAIKGIEKCP